METLSKMKGNSNYKYSINFESHSLIHTKATFIMHEFSISTRPWPVNVIYVLEFYFILINKFEN